MMRPPGRQEECQSAGYYGALDARRNADNGKGANRGKCNMTTFLAKARFTIQALALCAVVVLAASAAAQQPSLINPTADSVKEEQLLQELNRVQGRISIPDKRASVLEQPVGREWRLFHDVYLHWVGGVAIVSILALLVIFYLWRGTLRFEGGRSGRTMLRFNAFERSVHWMTAVCFVVLAISGLNITFGKLLLLPVMGPEAFSTWTAALKYSHNYLSFPFTIGVVLMFLLWVASNLHTRVDVEWIKAGGGMLGGEEPPAHRFNAGEKMIFWVVVFGGTGVATTGYLLMFPFYGTDIGNMQLAQIVHGLVGVLYVAAMLVHTYMGTIGMEGAFEGMATGEVDVNWAKSHHSLWYDEVARTGADRSSARPTATPAE
jgi:formate dehydrogenase subunit gamma